MPVFDTFVINFLIFDKFKTGVWRTRSPRSVAAKERSFLLKFVQFEHRKRVILLFYASAFFHGPLEQPKEECPTHRNASSANCILIQSSLYNIFLLPHGNLVVFFTFIWTSRCFTFGQSKNTKTHVLRIHVLRTTRLGYAADVRNGDRHRTEQIRFWNPLKYWNRNLTVTRIRVSRKNRKRRLKFNRFFSVFFSYILMRLLSSRINIFILSCSIMDRVM